MARKQIETVKRTREVKPNGKPLEQVVAKLVGNCSRALEKKEIKVTIADLFRLRELRKELAPQEFVRANVTWLDSGLDGGMEPAGIDLVGT